MAGCVFPPPHFPCCCQEGEGQTSFRAGHSRKAVGSLLNEIPWDLIAWSQEMGMRQVVLQPSSWAPSRVGVLCTGWLAASHATVVNFRARECDRVACLACMKPCMNQAWRGMVGPTIHNPRTHEGGGGRSTRNFRPSSIAHQAGNKSGIFSNDHNDRCLIILSHVCSGMAWSWF